MLPILYMLVDYYYCNPNIINFFLHLISDSILLAYENSSDHLLLSTPLKKFHTRQTIFVNCERRRLVTTRFIFLNTRDLSVQYKPDTIFLLIAKL